MRRSLRQYYGAVVERVVRAWRPDAQAAVLRKSALNKPTVYGDPDFFIIS